MFIIQCMVCKYNPRSREPHLRFSVRAKRICHKILMKIPLRIGLDHRYQIFCNPFYTMGKTIAGQSQAKKPRPYRPDTPVMKVIRPVFKTVGIIAFYPIPVPMAFPDHRPESRDYAFSILLLQRF